MMDIYKRYSLICYSNSVFENEIIENEDIKICPGQNIYEQNVSDALKGENQDKYDWYLPCGILLYILENKKVFRKENEKYFVFFVSGWMNVGCGWVG